MVQRRGVVQKIAQGFGKVVQTGACVLENGLSKAGDCAEAAIDPGGNGNGPPPQPGPSPEPGPASPTAPSQKPPPPPTVTPTPPTDPPPQSSSPSSSATSSASNSDTSDTSTGSSGDSNESSDSSGTDGTSDSSGTDGPSSSSSDSGSPAEASTSASTDSLSVVSMTDGSDGSPGTTVIVINGVATTESDGQTISLPSGVSLPSTSGGTLVYTWTPSATHPPSIPIATSSPAPSSQSRTSRHGPPIAAIVVPIIAALFLLALGIFALRRRRARRRSHPSQDYPFANPFAYATSAPTPPPAPPLLDTDEPEYLRAAPPEYLPAAPPKALQVMTGLSTPLVSRKPVRPLSFATSTTTSEPTSPPGLTDATVSTHMSFRSSGATFTEFSAAPLPAPSPLPPPPPPPLPNASTPMLDYRTLKDMRRNGENISKARAAVTPPATPRAGPTPMPDPFSDINHALDSSNSDLESGAKRQSAESAGSTDSSSRQSGFAI